MTSADTLPVVDLTVYGRPAPQGSKKAFAHATTGKVITQEMSKYVKPWRSDVRDAALVLLAREGRAGFPMDGPLVVDMVFTAARPQSHYRTGRNAHLLKDSAPLRPTGAPDLSKLARSTEDALTSAGVWRDDSRVVEYGRLAKVYAGEDVDALDAPGAVIRVRQMEVAR